MGLIFMLNIKTDKMTDKEKYKNLVQIIGELSQVKGNEWLIDEVFRVVGQSHSIDKIAHYPIINEIYEHCIKEVIKKQANDFYSKFPIKDKDLMDKIIYAFQEMEYNRRRDRFYEFSLNLNQQIEGITNYLFENKYKKEWDNIQYNELFRFKKEGKDVVSKLIDLVFPKIEDKYGKWVRKETWTNTAKLKLVYYLISENNTDKYNKAYYDTKDKIGEFHFISQSRNQVHIGGEVFEWQKKILAEIKGNESRYYFKFYGFLEDFISKIESSYSIKNSQQKSGDLIAEKKEKNLKKSSKKKSGNSHHQNNRIFDHLGLKKKVQQKARENKKNKKK